MSRRLTPPSRSPIDLPVELAEQVEDRELGRRHADPEGQPLVFVVVVVAVELPEHRLELAGVLAHEERRDPVEEDRVGVDHVHGIGDADPLGAVGCPHPNEEVATVAEQFHRGDLDRLLQPLEPEDRCLRDLVEPAIGRAEVFVGPPLACRCGQHTRTQGVRRNERRVGNMIDLLGFGVPVAQVGCFQFNRGSTGIPRKPRTSDNLRALIARIADFQSSPRPVQEACSELAGRVSHESRSSSLSS